MCTTRKTIRDCVLCAVVLVLAAWAGIARAQPEIIIGPIDCIVAEAVSYPGLIEFELLDPEDNEIPFPGFDYTPCGVGDPGPAAVWFSVIGTGNMMKVSTCELSSPGWADFDTQIGVYCQGCDRGTCVGGNDDVPGCNLHSTVEFCTQAGEEYLVYLAGFQGSFGQGALSITDSGTPCTATVDCAVTPEGACCIEACSGPDQVECAVMCEQCCTDMGGQYLGDGTDCVAITAVDDRVFLDQPYRSIPDGDPGGAILSIRVGPEESCIVGDVDVELQLSHTYIGDLIVEFSGPIAPGETNILTKLWNQGCGTTDNMNVIFDDDGGSPLCADISGGGPVVLRPPYDQYPPCGSSPTGPTPCTANYSDLGTFEGVESVGTWLLRIQDVYGGDQGVVESWALHITCAEPVCAVDDEGDDEGGDTAASQLQAVGQRGDATVLDARRNEQADDSGEDDSRRGMRGRRQR